MTKPRLKTIHSEPRRCPFCGHARPKKVTRKRRGEFFVIYSQCENPFCQGRFRRIEPVN